MASDISLGTADSWTLRSKICDEASVEVDWLEARANGRRVGEAATKRLGGEGDEVRGIMFAGLAIGEDCVALFVASMTVLLLSAALSFFFPSPKSRLLLVFAEAVVGGVSSCGETIGAVSD